MIAKDAYSKIRLVEHGEKRALWIPDVRMQIEQWKQEHEQKIRLDAVQRSSAITRGKVIEHIVPYLPGFDLDPADASPHFSM